MQSFAARVQNRYGQTDILINNAGVALGAMSLDEISYDDFRWVIDVNMWGVIHGAVAFLPMLRERPEASLVNVSSSFGLLAVPLQAPYCASKFAVRGFTDSLRLELLDSNVCVTLVCPSQIRTNIVRHGRHRDEASREELVRIFDRHLSPISAESMAETIVNGIVRKQEQIIFGSDAKQYWWASRFVPRRVIKALARQGLRKLDRLRSELRAES